MSIAVGQWAFAVYLAAFWHYYLYWLAYRYGRVASREFQRDALIAKSASLALLAWAYLAFQFDPLSALVVCAGFGLNAYAAQLLGADRTYYGIELGIVAWKQETRFPYSWIAHPMLVGNLAAYAGTLLNPPFRAAWWPLICLHLALNAGLVWMEARVTPLRGADPPRGAWMKVALGAALLCLAVAARASSVMDLPLSASQGMATGMMVWFLFVCYAQPFGKAAMKSQRSNSHEC